MAEVEANKQQAMAASNHHHHHQSSMNFFNNHLNTELWNHLSSMHPAMAHPAVGPLGTHSSHSHSNSHPFLGLQMPHSFFPYGAAHMPPVYSANFLANLASYPNLATSLPPSAAAAAAAAAAATTWKSPAAGVGFLPRYWLPSNSTGNVTVNGAGPYDAPTANVSAEDGRCALLAAADLSNSNNSEDQARCSPVQTAPVKEANILDLLIKIDPQSQSI